MPEPKIMDGKVADQTSVDFNKGVAQLIRTTGEICGEDGTLAWAMLTAAARYAEVAVVNNALQTITELQKEQKEKNDAKTPAE